MAESVAENLLARLAGVGGEPSVDPYRAVAATPPDHRPAQKAVAVQKAAAEPAVLDAAEKQRQDKLDQLLGKIAQLSGGVVTGKSASEPESLPADEYYPPEPATLHATKLSARRDRGARAQVFIRARRRKRPRHRRPA